MSRVTMPRLSDSMEEGTIVAWLKADGDEVAIGEALAEIETDKATMPYEAELAGRLTILAPAGATVAVGEPIATVGVTAEPATAAVAAVAQEAPATPPAAARTADSFPAPGAAGGTARRAARPKASPVARRLAAELGVALAGLTGTGPGGRIVKADVLGAPVAPASPPAPSVTPSTGGAAAGVRGTVTEQPLTRIQQVVARRMSEAKASIPEFTVAVDVAMDAAVELRAALKDAFAGGGAPVPSYNDLIVKAVAVALREQPRANAAYRDGAIQFHGRVNVGVAVAGDGSLMVPTVFDADRLSLGAIAARTRALAERARAGTVAPADLDGGTFTVSNLGMLGADRFAAVINPPQAAILAVGALTERPVVRDGELAVGHVMALTLTCDHRVLYGSDGAGFLARVRELLERPLALVAA